VTSVPADGGVVHMGGWSLRRPRTGCAGQGRRGRAGDWCWRSVMGSASRIGSGALSRV
jgi:hypothetical protein